MASENCLFLRVRSENKTSDSSDRDLRYGPVGAGDDSEGARWKTISDGNWLVFKDMRSMSALAILR